VSIFWEDLMAEVGAEPVEGVVIGEMGWPGYGDNDEKVPAEKRGVVLDATEASHLLAYPYGTGYGAPECHAVYVWTPTRVIYVTQYDGSTNVSWLPRNPTECQPDMAGG
jgi:hypothetical protein